MRKTRGSSRKKAKKRASDSSSAAGGSGSGSDINSVSDIPFLPDDILEDIVSRVPIKDVLRFKCVSKTCANLISDRDFIDKHMKRCVCVPMIVVIHSYGSGGPQHLVDKWWESNRKRAKLEKKCHLHPEYRLLLSSQDGLIVSAKEDRDTRVHQFLIFNPIFSETIELSLSSLDEDYDRSEMSREILGVFYRPCVKEYSTLWEFKVYSSGHVQYKVLDLCSESNWRTIKYPFSQYQRRYWHNKLILINGFLYWVCETRAGEFGIMVFDTSIEGFELIPSPIPMATTINGKKCTTSLVNGNSVLKLVQIFNKEEIDGSLEVNIWALTDGVKKIWSSSQYRMMSRIGNINGLYAPPDKINALWNGELLLVADDDKRRHKQIFVCNLELGTTRQFGRRYPFYPWLFTSHVMSLASIKSCKLKAIW